MKIGHMRVARRGVREKTRSSQHEVRNVILEEQFIREDEVVCTVESRTIFYALFSCFYAVLRGLEWS